MRFVVLIKGSAKDWSVGGMFETIEKAREWAAGKAMDGRETKLCQVYSIIKPSFAEDIFQ